MEPRAYVLALAAIGLWSTLAPATALVSGVDPLLVTGLCLCGGGLLTLPRWRAWRVPALTGVVGVVGIGGYHALYFAAFAQGAPRISVNLINYLWPLVMVLLAPLVLGDGKLRMRPIIGAGLGFAGCAVIAASDRPFAAGHALAYGLAAAAAVTWALYSLLTRRLPVFPSAAVGGFCLTAGALILVWVGCRSDVAGQLQALTINHWLVLTWVACGPLGFAFVCWDAALKRGDPRLIAPLAYLTPLASTVWLALLEHQLPNASTWLALALIAGGATTGGWPRRGTAS